MSVLLIVVHFAVPYFALLTQDSKMDPRRLKFMAHLDPGRACAGPVLADHADVSSRRSRSAGWSSAVPRRSASGLVHRRRFRWQMKRVNLVPMGDPEVAAGLGFPALTLM